MHHSLGIRAWADADVIALDRSSEGLGHSITPWTFDWGGSRFKADVASEAASIASDIAAAIVREPFDGNRQSIDRAEPMLNGSDHQVTHILACDATSGGEEAHGFTITAVEREGDPHRLSILAADLKAVGAP